MRISIGTVRKCRNPTISGRSLRTESMTAQACRAARVQSQSHRQRQVSSDGKSGDLTPEAEALSQSHRQRQVSSDTTSAEGVPCIVAMVAIPPSTAGLFRPDGDLAGAGPGASVAIPPSAAGLFRLRYLVAKLIEEYFKSQSHRKRQVSLAARLSEWRWHGLLCSRNPTFSGRSIRTRS